MASEEKVDAATPEKSAGEVDQNTRKTADRPARRSSPRAQENQSDSGDLIERVIKINRVAKVVKGGKNFSFSALVVTGDGKGSVGVGFGKSNEVAEAIKKGSSKSKTGFVKVKMKGDTIPHEVVGEFKSARVLLKPAGAGTGVIAGGPVRALCDAVGIKNILTKSLGSRNAINVVKATMDGFHRLRLKRRGQEDGA
jgi:small subunit ribosomal protein S5